MKTIVHIENIKVTDDNDNYGPEVSLLIELRLRRTLVRSRILCSDLEELLCTQRFFEKLLKHLRMS